MIFIFRSGHLLAPKIVLLGYVPRPAPDGRARTTYPTRSARGVGVAREPNRARVVVVGDAQET